MKKLLVLMIPLLSCTSISNRIYNRTYYESTRLADSLKIHEGLLSVKAEKIKYRANGKLLAVIELGKPTKIVQAEAKEKWGFFQFPTIGIADDSILVVNWSMKEDSYLSYGRKTTRPIVPMISRDGGFTWKPQEKKYEVVVRNYNVQNDDGLLQIKLPRARNINQYKKFPKPVERQDNYFFYKMEDLPEELKGVYFEFIDRKGGKTLLHAKLKDPGYLRYAIDSLMPIFWRGSIKHLSDGSLLAGVYPTYYQDINGKVLPGGISFYRSYDDGNTWNIQGKIPFLHDGIANKKGKSFDEPDFEVLSDSTLICVMRTADVSPMYQSFSADLGNSWSRPVPMSPNGVKPRLLLLKNGVLVLVSGRPGIQVRFSFDGTGRLWSDPIDFIPFMKTARKYRTSVSCGYASILECDSNSFYVVYSDFTTKNKKGEERKSIMFRKIKVERML